MSAFSDQVLAKFLFGEEPNDIDQCPSRGVNEDFKSDPIYAKLVGILDSKLTGKNRLAYGRPIDKASLLHLLHTFVTTIKRSGTCFFGSCDRQVPLGLALRTPSYLTSLLCVNVLLRHGHVELATEQNGNRVLLKGRPSCSDLAEVLAARLDQP